MTILPKKKQQQRERAQGGCGTSVSDGHIRHSDTNTVARNASGSQSHDQLTNTRKSRATSASNNQSSKQSQRNVGSSGDEERANSEDEYEPVRSKSKTVDDPLEEIQSELAFEEKLGTKGFKLHRIGGDGACLFRAVAHQIYGDEEMHGQVRTLCMDFMAKNKDHFSQFVTEDFSEYVARKRLGHVHGNHVEIQAIAELFNRPILVFENTLEPMNTFETTSSDVHAPIRVRYTKGVHYDSIIDPYGATIGVGLGMADLNPGLAEKNLLLEGERVSEQHDLEQTMLNDKIQATDWEATEQHIKEQVARDSYYDWLRTEENKMKDKMNAPCHSRSLPSPNAAILTTKPASPHTQKNTQTINKSGGSSPSASSSKPAPSLKETDSIFGAVPPAVNDYGLSDWASEDEMMRQVLALSQQEYINSFRKEDEKS